VIVDAPCSNSGVFARRPEARWRYDERALASLASLQRALLASGSALASPGGRVVYSTCSVDPHENQGIAHGLGGWRILAEERTWPDAWQGGGYAALLVRS
jgi:16S rRNA (cytosine967-C5)-methyltransferase